MTERRVARTREPGTLPVLAAVIMLFLGMSGAKAADAGVPFIAPGSPPSYVPDGSTWVPKRDSLAATDSTPQTVGTLCTPNVGTPTTAPSQLDAAFSPTVGVIVSSEGYMAFDRSNPAGCANMSFASWSTLFASLPAGSTFSEPHVIYDPHAGKFAIAVLVVDAVTTLKTYLFVAEISAEGTPSTGGPVPGLNTSLPNVMQDLTFGFDKDYWLIAYDFTTGGGILLHSFITRIDKSFHVVSGIVTASTRTHLIAPLILDDSTSDNFLSVDTAAKNRIWRVVPNFLTSSATETAISVSAFDLPPPLAQSNGATLLADDGNFHAPTIQIGNSLWNVHTIGIDGHARLRLYKFDTTATSPMMTFTPFINGNEDLFAPSVATASDAAGSTAFVTATYNNFEMIGSPLYALAFNGPNDSTDGWTYDVIGSDTNFTAGGSQWATHSATWMNPGETTAWGFNQLAAGGAATDWSIAGAEITPPGAPLLAPIASSATNVGNDHFTAHWSDTTPPATAYEIDVATDSAFTHFVPGYQAKNVGNFTFVDVTGLSAGTTYYYRVRAVGGLSSNTIEVMTDAEVVAVGPLELLGLTLLAFGGLALRQRSMQRA